jgi:Transcriptional regulators
VDYRELADELMRIMHRFHKANPRKPLNAAMQGEAFVMQYLCQQQREVQPGEISAEMNISTARIAATLNGLEVKGFVTRRIDPEDRRRILVEITPSGKEAGMKHFKKHMDEMVQLLEGLGENDAKEFVRILKKMQENAAKMMEGKQC